jgi:hypothetical protein
MSLNERNKLTELEPAGSGQLSGVLAELALAVGKMGSQLERPLVRPRIPWEACHPVGPIGALSASGTFDTPDVLGPHDPYWWDLRRWSAWGFTAGTVTLFKNATPALGGTQIGSLSAPGNVTWSTQELLAPRDRLIITGTGITGNVQFEVRAIEVESRWLPEYLM